MKLTIHTPEDPLVLTHVLMVYENASEKVLQRGKIAIEDDRAVIKEIAPVTESLTAILLDTRERLAPLTYIPEPVVGVTDKACAWFVPAQSRPLFFRPTRDVTLNDLSGQHFPQPPLLMISTRNNLSVYALEHNVRPTLATPLMNAPYYNIFDTDTVCLGSAYRPFDGTIEHLHEWEASFYGSQFTHRAGTTTRWITDRTHRELWESAHEAGAFDPGWLIAANTTLADVLGRAR